MGHRLVELLIIGSWLISMSWLVVRDVIPRWTAQTPPETATTSWLRDNGKEFQFGIFDHAGLRRGSCWSVYQVNNDTIIRKELLLFERLSIIPELAIQSEMTFLNETELVAIDIEIKGVPLRIELHGERQGPKFGFELQIDRMPVHDFVLDGQAAKTLCDVTKPFSSLRGLDVGRSWKIYVIDPFSLIRGSRRAKLKPVVVTVIGRETIQIEGRKRPCFVVESQGAKAWVDDAGRVLKQIVDVPGVGQMEIREQSFQRDKYEAALRRLRGVERHDRGRNPNH